MPTYAYCWASGQIEFGTQVPEGAIWIVRGRDTSVRHLIDATARLAYDNTTLLVPGIPEAENQKVAGDALARFLTWLGSKPHRGIALNKENA
ncbi:MAG: host nuclease inhibitor protein [Bordetella sp. SCN 67-23]|nr:host nuclease inhibitor protein [Burkholderiales bacterium]ODS75895.1 MAG: host nuclease inhibitor protein [Bordetella sp. SCN 67-23]OJW91771.1 MAG: host nuclease inhibitor protein [Burkholderiales bacterium 67-32]